MAPKIIRSLCLFTDSPEVEQEERLKSLSDLLLQSGFEVQTCRIVTKGQTIEDLGKIWPQTNLFLGAGTLSRSQIQQQLPSFLSSNSISFNLEIQDTVTEKDVSILFEIIRNKPEKTFNFSYTFCNAKASAFFPAAHHYQNGFAVGLQPTDLTKGCNTLEEWFTNMKEVWQEIEQLFSKEADFLGIDSSIAPMYSNDSSLVHLMKKLHGSFSHSVTSDSYTRISKFIKEENPMPIGLCGLMFPCLEDFELADEYEKGEFSIERNIFLSLHSGLGIDTYPIGIDESPERIQQILNLLLALANKYNKALSARFVSDGITTIGQKSNFKNPFLKDVIIKKL